jgi:TetR/AcrR family transcriptional regulator, regulator of autoinduction and epiphytic fitness
VVVKGNDAPQPGGTRRYVSSQRQAQAQRTRMSILDAAERLFVQRGYAASTLAAVAAEAGVAVQTVYAAFGSKSRLLSDLVDVRIAGDDEPVALPDRPFVARIRAAGTPRAKLRIYAAHLAEVNARMADVLLALAGAATADADAAAIWRKNIEERHAGMTMFAADLSTGGALLPEHTAGSAADVLWLAMDVRNYDWLVRQRGWSVERYQDWYVRTVEAALFGTADTATPPAGAKPAGGV